MLTIPLDAVPIAGEVDREVTATGVVFRRSPLALRHQLDPDPGAARDDARRDAPRRTHRRARELELDVLCSVLVVRGIRSMDAVFDLVVDGELRSSATASAATHLVIDPVSREMTVEPGGPSTIRFDDLPGTAGTRVEVWLPHRSVVELRAVRISDGASVDAPPPRRRWVHYGSSISHCLEVDHPTDAWPTITARRADVDLVNLGVAGQCMLDAHVARTIRDLDVDLVSVKAGINIVEQGAMKERAFVPALHGFLDTVRDRHPHVPVVVATPIIWPQFEDAESAAGAITMRQVRQLVPEIVAARVAAGDTQLHLVDGLALFGNDDVADLPDGLHPNAAGYRRIGERFHDLVFVTGGPFAAT